jgi:hypothetical protein
VREALQLGLWFSSLGLFYPELSDTENMARLWTSQPPALLDWHEYWGAYDWGFAHPACFASFVRVKNTVYWLDTLYLHRYQDEEQAAAIKGQADQRCFRTVYAGHDAFAKRMAHSAVAETVADVFGRYSIHLERANIDRQAGSQVVRRLVAPPRIGPQPKEWQAPDFRIVDTLGNRRAVAELAALVPEADNPKVPSKRDANERGLQGDDGADVVRYGLATPSFEAFEPPRVWSISNVDDGVDHEWDQMTAPGFRLLADGRIDKRVYALAGQPGRGAPATDTDLDQFPESA